MWLAIVQNLNEILLFQKGKMHSTENSMMQYDKQYSDDGNNEQNLSMIWRYEEFT